MSGERILQGRRRQNAATFKCSTELKRLHRESTDKHNDSDQRDQYSGFGFEDESVGRNDEEVFGDEFAKRLGY